ncbi:MAG: hypothetical protein JRI89_12260 [Deltaproteobacteria bacterium]|nr:hypothetical protein [Deltaproteobacteria bacterium]
MAAQVNGGEKQGSGDKRDCLPNASADYAMGSLDRLCIPLFQKATLRKDQALIEKESMFLLYDANTLERYHIAKFN